MTWTIPPVGWCAMHLLRGTRTPAATVDRGTSLCEECLKDAYDVPDETPN